VLEVGRRPVASPLARLQAGRGQFLVSNLWHAFVRLDERERLLLMLLDGSRDQAAVAAALEATTTAEERDTGWLGQKLERLAQLGLLTG
jgi:hypothetical protein